MKTFTRFFLCACTQTVFVMTLSLTSQLSHAQDGATILPELQGKKPSDNWTAQDSATDESGESDQGTAPGFAYADDRYENLDYDSNSAGSADIPEASVGNDGLFLEPFNTKD